MARIIVIDDQPESVKLLRGTLRQAGHEVEVYNDGRAGFAAVKDNPPELVIADAQVRGLGGLDIAVQIRDDLALRDLAVLIVMDVDNTINRIDGLQAADDNLGKPIKKGVLIAKVNALLRRSSLSGGLKGKLELIGGAAAALQMVLFSHDQGALVFDDSTIIYLDNKRIAHVDHPDLAPEEALMKVLKRRSGAFRFEPRVSPPERTLNLKPETAMLEAAKETDEDSRDSAHLPLIDVTARDLIVVPNVAVVRTYIETSGGAAAFSVVEGWDEKNRASCLVFEGQGLRLTLLRSSLQDLPADFRRQLTPG